jgi:glutamate racemase
VRFALVNSGLGVLAAAAELRRQHPDADLVLAIDPDGMPWGPRSPDDIAKRSLICAEAAAQFDPDVLIFACNTASVYALSALRAEFEPAIPVVGTVPAIKPAAAAGHPVAIWATAATTGSPYQRDLISQFAGGAPVTEVACAGLADAIDAGDVDRTDACVAAAAAQTPSDVAALVLGCTEYELIGDRIGVVLPGVRLHGSAPAVAAQAVRRAADHRSLGAGGAQPGPAGHSRPVAAAGGPALRVLLSGRPGELPPAAFRYPEGRFLAPLASGDPVSRPGPAGPPPSRFSSS